MYKSFKNSTLRIDYEGGDDTETKDKSSDNF